VTVARQCGTDKSPPQNLLTEWRIAHVRSEISRFEMPLTESGNLPDSPIDTGLH
jgi:hypothetical protein